MTLGHILMIYKFNIDNADFTDEIFLEKKVKHLIKHLSNSLYMLFGIFAVHNPDLCPLNNIKSKKIFLELQNKMKVNSRKFNILKIIAFYMSVLEHEWIIILDAKNAHDIEQFCIAVGISSTSTVKIVPINDFRKVVKRLQH